MTMKVCLMLIGVITLLGCSRGVITNAGIHHESIEIFVTEDSPPRVVVEFDVRLINGCNGVHSTDFWWEEEICFIEVKTIDSSSLDVVCAAALFYHPVSVCIGMLEAGTYTVKINSYSYPFLVRKNSTGTYIDPNYRVNP